jgi:type III restriction enzyme
VDESHHAVSALSREMLANFNPSFVLDLTATPKKDANIISYVDALQLKKEDMVKLPVIVYNMRTKAEVIGEAIYLRRRLEAEAIAERQKTGRYIRPIALFQAEPKGKDDNTTFEKLKKELIEAGIPKSHIAIKTADVNELRGVELLSEDCPIRYIITVNALKEGWDCPFAYILATVANRSSVVDVEQILGRVLRLPHTERNEKNTLNISYCLTSSDDFHKTLGLVVKGLLRAGFSEKDYDPHDYSRPAPKETPPAIEQQSMPEAPEPSADEDEAVDPAAIKEYVEARENPVDSDNTSSRPDPLSFGEESAGKFDDYVERETQTSKVAEAVREKMHVFEISKEFAEEAKGLLLPQFVMPRDIPLLTGDTDSLLSEDALSVGFTLKNKDAMIDFLSIDAEIARVDIDDSTKDRPKAWKLKDAENEFFRELFNSQPTEKRMADCKENIRRFLDKDNNLAGVSDYLDRIIGTLTTEQIEDLLQSPYKYAEKIRKKIKGILLKHREDKFNLWLEQSKITVKPHYAFPKTIAPLRFTQTMPNSLYTAEEDMNGLEKDVVWAIANLPNIRWWHRNISKTGFCVNGFENAYPDVIVMMKNGKLLLLETKGDHLENTESKRKCYIGRKWASLAGANYGYYMVFRDKELKWDGAVRFDRLLEIVRGM